MGRARGRRVESGRRTSMALLRDSTDDSSAMRRFRRTTVMPRLSNDGADVDVRFGRFARLHARCSTRSWLREGRGERSEMLGGKVRDGERS